MPIPESKTPHFGLRDFLFYLLPGSIIFISFIYLFQSEDLFFDKTINLGSSIMILLFSYFIGQVNYGFTYYLRNFLNTDTVIVNWIKKKNESFFENINIEIISNKTESEKDFEKSYMLVIEKGSSYFTTQIFRYRNFARFSLTMIFPSLLFGITTIIRFLKSDHYFYAIIILVITCYTVKIFLYRYFRYTYCYQNQVNLCEEYIKESYQNREENNKNEGSV